MKKKLLIIFLITIILIIFVLFFFRFNIYTLKVIQITDHEIYATTLDGTEYYFFYKDNTIVLNNWGWFVDFSEIQEGDVVKILSILHYFSTTDGLGSAYSNGEPMYEIEGFKIVMVL